LRTCAAIEGKVRVASSRGIYPNLRQDAAATFI
jgi:hypothetical protein